MPLLRLALMTVSMASAMVACGALTIFGFGNVASGWPGRYYVTESGNTKANAFSRDRA